jgi:electron transfer flavoprotein beta subunit
MEIVVLVKPVPEPETRLRPNAGGTALDQEGVKWVLAGYDESAVEQALLLKESIPGSSVRAISFGPVARTEEVLRASLALGCDTATVVEQPPEVALDPIAVARGLAVPLRSQKFDLLLGGKQAGDDESGVVVPALAEFLGLPEFSPVVDLRWDPAVNRFTFQVAVEGGADRIRASPPVVIGLQQAWNDPRTARLPNILKSRRMTLDRVPWPSVQSDVQRHSAAASASFRLPAPRTGAKMIEYKEPDEAARKLVQLLTEEAKVFP